MECVAGTSNSSQKASLVAAICLAYWTVSCFCEGSLRPHEAQSVLHYLHPSGSLRSGRHMPRTSSPVFNSVTMMPSKTTINVKITTGFLEAVRHHHVTAVSCHQLCSLGKDSQSLNGLPFTLTLGRRFL